MTCGERKSPTMGGVLKMLHNFRTKFHELTTISLTVLHKELPFTVLLTIISIRAASDPSLLNPLVSESYGELLLDDICLLPDDIRPNICSIGDKVSFNGVDGVIGVPVLES
jgi:hypothetical protein